VAFDAAGAERLSLGERILRVETAAVVAAALALSASPDETGGRVR
jgi:16S rRNA U1498 N3-methylase RsmE